MAKGMFHNPNDLPKWDKEDMKRAEGCRWMMDREYKDHPDMKFFDKIREFHFWYTKLNECLPTPELYTFKTKTKELSMVFDHTIFVRRMKFARQDMVQKLLAYDYHKALLVESSSKAYQQNINSNTNKTISEDIREDTLLKQYPDNTPLQLKQMNEKVEGYIPTEEYLIKLPPMELIEYCGFKLIKYDKWHGYYAAMIVFPKDSKHQPIVNVLYDENSTKLEMMAEAYFNKYIDEYINNEKNNPYGDKEFADIDISHVKKSMNDPTSNPLGKDIF